MKVVGVDSAERTGFAVIERRQGDRERLLRSGSATIRGAADVEAMVVDMAAFRPDVVVIEGAYIDRRHPHAGLMLARLLGRWLQAFESRGIETMVVPASCWQPAILSGLMPVRALREERKAAARLWVKATFGLAAKSDEADAIALAAFVLRSTSRVDA